MKKNKILKSALIIGLLAAFSVGGLSGCGNSQTSETSQISETSQASTVSEVEKPNSKEINKIEKTLAEAAVTNLYYESEDDTDTSETDDTDTTEYPESFDLREYPTADGGTANVVGQVKSQYPWGTCWSFGAISACEISLNSQNGIDRNNADDNDYDLSELHLAYFAYDYERDNEDNQKGEGMHFADNEKSGSRLDMGGDNTLTTSLLSAGIGPEEEEEVPYKNSTGAVDEDEDGNAINWSATPASGWTVDQSLKYSGVADLKNGNILPSPANADAEGIQAIKSELSKGRGVSIAYAADANEPGETGDDTYFNYDTWAQCTDTAKDIDHQVCIVGWDDNYSKENFAEGHIPEGDGAWIVKNSWGAEVDTDGSEISFPDQGDWGIVDEETGKHTGYFYLSYYDQTVADCESFEFSSLSAEDNYECEVFTYDYMPYGPEDLISVRNTEIDADSVKMANVFHNTSGESISVQDLAYTTTVAGSKVKWEVYVYNTDETTAEDVLYSQQPLVTYEQEFEYKGFHRVTLDNSFELKDNQSMIVVVTEESNGKTILGYTENTGKDYLKGSGTSTKSGLSKASDDDEDEEDEDDENETAYCVGVVNEGESLVSVDGKWVDWSNVVKRMKKLVKEEDGYSDMYSFDNMKIKAYGIYED